MIPRTALGDSLLSLVFGHATWRGKMRFGIQRVCYLSLMCALLSFWSGTSSAQSKENPLKVAGNIKAPKIAKYVAPEYPKDAEAKGIKGLAMLAVVVADTGAIDSVKVLKSPAELAGAAEKAVKQWRYEPTIVDGKAAWLSMTVTVPFPPKKN